MNEIDIVNQTNLEAKELVKQINKEITKLYNIKCTYANQLLTALDVELNNVYLAAKELYPTASISKRNGKVNISFDKVENYTRYPSAYHASIEEYLGEAGMLNTKGDNCNSRGEYKTVRLWFTKKYIKSLGINMFPNISAPWYLTVNKKLPNEDSKNDMLLAKIKNI